MQQQISWLSGYVRLGGQHLKFSGSMHMHGLKRMCRQR
jgi:hypothetical protein